ncbi:MAG: 4-hydroxythreonine-4-phosphate dehydrogenase PdxA [bacterium]
MKKPIVGITMGDAAGIGPEVIIKALNTPSIYEECLPVVIGDGKVLLSKVRSQKSEVRGQKIEDQRPKIEEEDRSQKTEYRLRISDLNIEFQTPSPESRAPSPEINSIQEISEAKFEFGTIDCLDLDNINLDDLEIGKISRTTGKAAIEYIKKAVNLALDNKIQAITTAPISKESINKAGFHFAGHTDFIAGLTHRRQYAMMFVSDVLKVVLVTIHIPLHKAVRTISKKKVLTTIRLTHSALKDYFGIQKPKIGVAGLNPHAGESGLFGKEEEKEIIPAIEVAQRKGIDAKGPYPPDTIFYRAVKGEFDVVIAMYHDQGLIPLKLLAFDDAVNVTIGLPIIRTSPDHGTAFDIAGKNIASPKSILEAIKLAAKMSKIKGGKQ